MAASSALRCHDVRLRRRGRRRYDAARRRGRTPLATAYAAHFVRGICRYGCDRMCGSLRSGDMSPRAGRDSSRPRLSPPLGRNKCDPPANHHSLPTAIYISTLLHGHFYDGEAPSLRVRPHVRLTSFGGYVATMPHDGEGAVATGATACAAHFVRGICRYDAARRRGAVATGATACAARFVRGICRYGCGHRCCGEAGGVACGDGALAVAGGMAAARLLLRMMPVMVYYAAKGDEHD